MRPAVRLLGNITASLCMVARLSRLADAGRLAEEQAPLAKAFRTKMRETVGLARELLGGNRIRLEFESAGSSPTPKRFILMKAPVR